jgi:hypothetical protein
MKEMRQGSQERSIGELFAELAKEMSTLVRQEVGLAKTELTQKATRAGRNIGYLLAGSAVAYGAFLAFAATAIIALAEVMPWWAAALVVGLVIAAIAAVLVSKALNALKELDPAPRQTLETLKEDVRWAKNQMK